MSAGDDPLTDQTLVQRCLARDEAAWSTLFHRFHAPLVRLAAMLLGPGRGRLDLAEDLVGRVWLSLVVQNNLRLRLYNPRRGSLRTFLNALTRQHFLQAMRLRPRREVPLPDGHPDPRPASPISVEENLREFRRTLTRQEGRFYDVHLMGYHRGARPVAGSPAYHRKLKQRILARAYTFLGRE
jgi:DNA-directed RNA polymerase specialized sigma24 family protein